MKFINKLFLHFDDETIKLFESNEEVLNKIFKANLIEWTISNFDKLLEIIKLLPDDFSRINFAYNNWISESITDESCFDIAKSLDYIGLTFWVIRGNGILQYNELNLIWKILLSRRTRFNISSIWLTLKFLSECRVVLPLWEDCLELKSVFLYYKEADEDNEQELIQNLKTEFKNKFGLLWSLNISKI